VAPQLITRFTQVSAALMSAGVRARSAASVSVVRLFVRLTPSMRTKIHPDERPLSPADAQVNAAI
jgi:hypothetical protein